MALYDNQHWLLSLIRDNFISFDYSGIMEMVLLSEDIPKKLQNSGALHSYPGAEESDEEIDSQAESYDIQMDMKSFNHRERTVTAQRLEKLEQENRKAAKIKHIKWELNPNITREEQQEMFKWKDFKSHKPSKNRQSVFSEQLEKCPTIPKNPFVDFAKFDGSAQFEHSTKKYRICMCLLPKEKQLYPLQICVVCNATIKELIGLICYKYINEHPDQYFEPDISKLGLYMTEDDEVDWDFPCLDPSETVGKFDFTTLGLVEMKPSDQARHNTISTFMLKKSKEKLEEENDGVAKDLEMMEIHTTAMEAPLYQLYRVYIINKVKTKTEVHLGISGEKIEIDPVALNKGASRFWNRQRAVSHHIDNVAWCELTENKGSKTIFTLVYTNHSSRTIESLNVSLGSHYTLRRSTSFKQHEFEADAMVASEIVRKINNILELRNSSSRKEYLIHKERKTSRRKSFHIPR